MQVALVELDLQLQQLVSAGKKTALEGTILRLEFDAQRERLWPIVVLRAGRVIQLG